MTLQSQAIYVHRKNNFKQRISILENGASGEQVGDIENIIVKNCSKYNYITWIWYIFEKKQLLWPQVYNEFMEYGKKIQVQNVWGHETYVQNYI